MKKIALTVSLLILSWHFSQVKAQLRHLVVQVNKPVTELRSTMWGIFFEDINFAADGGLYAELVKNRSFEFNTPMMGWNEIKRGGTGKVLMTNQAGVHATNTRFVHLSVDAGKGVYGLENEGFRGIGVQKDKEYIFSILLRNPAELKFHVELMNSKGEKIGESLPLTVSSSGQWEKRSVTVKATQTDPRARLQVLFHGKAELDADMISLFPKDTWKNRPGGLRADLVQMLADLKPGFIRFPGGCIVEGRELQNRYQWKTTVGPVEDRKLIVNRWNTEFKDPRNAADYFQSFGLGFYEYFILAEDIGAEPLPILNCGMACQFNTAEVSLDIDPYIQDALDLIEFANGSENTKWGKLRKDMGHPAPFNLKFLGIGNEQWDEQYIERYKEFDKVLRRQHPEIKLISGSGPGPDGPRFDYAWKELRKLNADLVDEHYYRSPEWFFNNAGRYDNYDRSGPNVFAGEYAAHVKDSPVAESRNTFLSALAEAAFMTGLERNADIVHMASYAPLLAHVDAWQWHPDLIWFDNLKAIASPNYYVQKFFSASKGTHVVPVLGNGAVLAGKDSIYASASMDKKSNILYLKIVNVSGAGRDLTIDLEGASTAKYGTMEVLTANSPMAYNSLEKPAEIVPVHTALKIKGKSFNIALKPASVNLLSIPLK